MEELKDENKRKSILDSNANMRSVLDEDVIKEREFVQKNKSELQYTASILLVDMWKVYPLKSTLLSFLPSRFGVLSKATSNVKDDAKNAASNAVRSSMAKASEKMPDKEEVKTKIDSAVVSTKQFAQYMQTE